MTSPLGMITKLEHEVLYLHYANKRDLHCLKFQYDLYDISVVIRKKLYSIA